MINRLLRGMIFYMILFYIINMRILSFNISIPFTCINMYSYNCY